MTDKEREPLIQSAKCTIEIDKEGNYHVKDCSESTLDQFTIKTVQKIIKHLDES